MSRYVRGLLLAVAGAGIGLMGWQVSPATATSHCQSTGVDSLTAHYINESPLGPLVVTCDIGVFFDEDGALDGASISGTVAGAKSVQYGVYVSGATVDVTNSTITVDSNYPHQFVSITYRDGATGTISRNNLSGAHRAGMVIRGAGTNITIRSNIITGTGARTSGWAENGIQVDQSATANIVNNTITGHWWDGESNWASTGIMILSSDTTVTNNVLIDNEFSLYVAGRANRVSGNRTTSAVVSQSPFAFRAWGILVSGSDNHVAGNRLGGENGAAGIYIFAGSNSNRLTGNRIMGFEWPIIDQGTDTMARGNPSPATP